MSDVLKAFYAGLAKEAAERETRRSPLRALAATAPFVLGNAAAEFPKGVVEEGIETGINRGVRKIPSAGRRALRQGAGRLAGEVGAASVTTPLFLKGIKDIKEGNTKKGTAEVVAAGTLFSGIKGGIEGGATSKGKGEVVKAMKRLGTSRGITGAASAALVANQVGRSLRDGKDGKKKSKKEKYLGPVLAGMAAGAGKGAFDKVWDHRSKGTLGQLSTKKGLRGVAAKAAGRSAGGAIGAAAMTALASRVLGGKEKRSSVGSLRTDHPSESYLVARGTSYRDPRQGIQTYKQALQMPESPRQRALAAGSRDGLISAGYKGLPKPRAQKHTEMGGIDVPSRALLVAGGLPSLLFPALHTPGEVDNFIGQAKGWIPKGTSFVDGAFDAWDPDSKTVHLGPKADAAVIAHELGHARAGHLRKSLLQSGTSLKVGNAARTVASVAAVATLAQLFDDGFKTADELDRDARRLSFVGKATLLAAAPQLLEEGLATREALDILQKTGRMSVKGVSRLAAAYGTYAVPILLTFAGASRLRSRAENLRRER